MAVLNSTGGTQRSPTLPVDRTLLAIGNSGSSLAVSLDDVASIWLSHLNLIPSVKLKLETDGVVLPDGDLPLSTAFPPISLFLSTSTPVAFTVTTQLVALLPQLGDVQQQLLDSLDDVLALHPSFNYQDFQTRVYNLFSWSSEAETREHAVGNSTLSSTSTSRSDTRPRPTLSFFSAASAAFALGLLVYRRTNASRFSSLEDDKPAPSNPCPLMDEDQNTSPAALFALSEQALNFFERSHNYDLDCMVAMILQVMYLLHDGSSRLPHILLPMVSAFTTTDPYRGLRIPGWKNGEYCTRYGSQPGPR